MPAEPLTDDRAREVASEALSRAFADDRCEAAGSKFQLRLVGGFELRAEPNIIDIPESAQRLIAFLALRRRVQTRLAVAGSLWPDKTDSRATANLRSTLWRARLEDGTSVLRTKGSMVGLTAGLWLDVRDIESLKPDSIVGGVLTAPAPSYDRLFDQLLPGWYDDWVIIERERLAQIQLRIAERLAGALVAEGNLISATDIAFRTIALDPTGFTRDRITECIP